MNEKSIELLEHFVPKNYIQQGHHGELSHENEIRILLEKRKLPEKPWSEQRIELFINQLSIMDSNNFWDNCGLGEREGRIYSSLVARRNYHLAHGIGRSGDLIEPQPKAIGSSVLNKLTNEMSLDIVKMSGLTFAKRCVVIPMSTGMTLAFCMMSIRQLKPDAKYVIMPRIDQKSCIKSIITAGFTPVILENRLHNEELRTDVGAMVEKINELDPKNIACVFSTTSCFAPRAPDNVEDIGGLCKKFEIFHLVNNAYGLQSTKCTHIINQASREGRVDLVIQSTDKNLMVPVGGTLVVAFDDASIERVTKLYPGRASASQSLDLLITFLSMGSETYKQLLDDRKTCFEYLRDELRRLAERNGERLIETPGNTVSLAMSLKHLGHEPKQVTQIGSMLFHKLVSGTRVIVSSDEKDICGVKFKNFGSHSNAYPCAYLTASASIGIKKADIDTFLKRLQKVFDSAKHEK